MTADPTTRPGTEPGPDEAPDPGQTGIYDPFRLHLLSAHRNLAALGLTDTEATENHEDEHRGTYTSRDHHPLVLHTDVEMMIGIVGEEQDPDLQRLWRGHQARSARSAAVADAAPHVFERATRFTVSVLPEADPWRRHYEIQVHRRPSGEWIVVRDDMEWADTSGNWAMISSDTAEGRLFTFGDAMALARRLAPGLQGNRHTALEVLHLPVEGRRD